MPYETEDYIHLENPDYKESDFRKNNKGEINIVGTVNFGNGVSGRLGLLKSSGESAVYVFLFKTTKWDEDSAKEWLEKDRNKRGKSMVDYIDKKFKFNMPLVKGELEKDGHYYIKFALSTTTKDLENEEVSEECLDSMIEQAKTLNSFQCHVYGLNDIIGPIVDAWKEVNDGITQMWIKVRVVPSMKDKIKELIDTGVRLGGSIGGSYIKDRMEDGTRILEEIKLLEGSLTPLPVNQDTLGTATEADVKKNCPGGMCNQILKSIQNKYYKDMEVQNVSKTESQSYEELIRQVNEAVRNRYRGVNNESTVYVKLTFPDSVIVLDWENGNQYEIPYTIDEESNVVLGESVEVEEMYVEKKMEIFKDKAIYVGEMPEELKEFKGDESMEEKDIKKMIDESNKELLKEIKEMIEVKEPEIEPEIEPVKAIDPAKIAEEVTANIYKSLGIEVEEEKEPEAGNIVIMDSKALEDLQEETIKKTILGIAKQRDGLRKSKPTATGKFDFQNDPTEEKKSNNGGKVSSRKAAEMLAERKGLA